VRGSSRMSPRNADIVARAGRHPQVLAREVADVRDFGEWEPIVLAQRVEPYTRGQDSGLVRKFGGSPADGRQGRAGTAGTRRTCGRVRWLVVAAVVWERREEGWLRHHAAWRPDAPRSYVTVVTLTESKRANLSGTH
jgi:hypothetical protein